MKKRITALILVVVMSVLSLFGCGEYDYADADLNEFSSVNVAALKNALKNIVIDDEEIRNFNTVGDVVNYLEKKNA